MKLSVIYFKTWGSTKPHVTFWTFEFLVALFIAELPLTTISFHFWTECFLCYVSSLFSWLDNGACSLLCGDLSLRHPAHLLY
jgi:hypothetical protein